MLIVLPLGVGCVSSANQPQPSGQGHQVTEVTAPSSFGLCRVKRFSACTSFDIVQSFSRDEAFASADKCLYHTRDDGESWQKLSCDVDATQTEARIDGLDFVSPTTGWALANNGISRSIDGGLSWRNVVTGDRTFPRGFRFYDGAVGYWVGEEVASGQTNGQGVIFVTRDGGLTWTQSNPGVSLPFSWRLRDVWPLSREEAWVVGDVLLHTRNAGESWERLPIDESWRNDSITFVSSVLGWIGRYPKGHYLLTFDGGLTWRPFDTPGAEESHGLSFINQREGWVAIDGQIRHTSDSGASWTTEERCNSVPTHTPGAYYSVEYLPSTHEVMLTGTCARASFSVE
jgi:photosystem II stability/assembly factor-like uncharacterized protein